MQGDEFLTLYTHLESYIKSILSYKTNNRLDSVVAVSDSHMWHVTFDLGFFSAIESLSMGLDKHVCVCVCDYQINVRNKRGRIVATQKKTRLCTNIAICIIESQLDNSQIK